MSYTDVFNSSPVPPANSAYSSYTLAVNTTFSWSYNAGTSTNAIAKIMDVSCSAGVVLTLPAATEAALGEDFLLRNVGAETLTIKDNSGVTIDTVASGISKYYFVSDNSTVAGIWESVTFGAGSSSATAGDLVGYGLKAITTSLNQSHSVVTFSVNTTIDSTYRAKMVVATGGTTTVSLPAVATAGDDFFFMFRNEGTGTVTIDPNASETFDSAATFLVQPGESLMAVCSGSAWYSVGYGRSTLYQFTQLVKDVSAAGSFTLTAAEASNKLLSFIGNPGGAVTIVVPNTVAIYYTQSAISTAQTITVKTAAGSGSPILQSQRQILICDGTNVTSAQSAIASGGLSLDNGSAAAPSLSFATATNTGLFLKGINGVGIAANGVEIGAFETTGLELVSPMAVTEGGTGRATSTTAYGLIAAGTTATGVQQTLATGSANNVLLSGGAAALPSWANEATFKAALNLEAGVDFQAYDADLTTWAGITPGANVGTALAVAIGSAGAVVVNGGALGTPSSGTLTNCTGLPVAGVVGLGTLATQNGTFSGTSSGTNTGDNAVNTLYSGLVSNATHTGDVTGATALTIANDAVTYAKMQNVSATDKLLGRATAGSGDVEEITCTAAGRALLDDADATAQRATLGLVIGTNVQAYDAATAKINAAQTFSAPQRGTLTTDNDGSFDLNATNNFKCTPAAPLALTFTNVPAATASQSGNILLVNTGGHAITAAAGTKIPSATLTAISAAGTYLLGYFSDGTNVYVAASGAMV